MHRHRPHAITPPTVLTAMLMLAIAAGCSPAEEAGAQTPDPEDRQQQEANVSDHPDSQTSAASAGQTAKTVHPGDRLPAPAVDEPLVEGGAEPRQAVLAGGCFWCTEAVFEQIDGVHDVVSGYAGGSADTADYYRVASGRTDHAEAICITYDPARVTLGRLLRIFFATHDPTQLNRQGPDTGRQYRSAVFYADEEQKRVAEAYIRQLKDAEAFPRPIVTTLEPLAGFYEAEAYHQDFARRNPLQAYIQQWALPKVKKVREKFPEQIKDESSTP